ncbi:tRNA/tmRNA/rRNA uracil-C5-methylase [Nocardioides gansuensis]|uniref:tRNA/tmRNA/rRNA uracil-C5-methylase n=1 Tax=Nocardioides gansuensis TaxID=2138300 RepID=A0A2T8FDD6_9ACTN|nr:methyltransferase [Nocardioides gansuensis]PVG83713.1 tRNA/tmRNA/rRNA uracil-C5-methylase [Nocardioides gansuensis]
MSRHTRQRRARGRSRVGERFETVVGPVAHGGHCVARVEDGARVVFVRHALPGERVVVEVTEGTDGDRFWRGDAVEVLEPSPDRVLAPCPVSGPGLCGGCDFQHVALPAQRELKAAVVREQLVRLARLDEDDPLVAGLVVEPVAGDHQGLRWRTRMQWATAPDGRRGLRAHRSRTVVPVDDCLIAVPDARAPLPGPPVTESVLGRDFVVEPDGFWQVHPGAPQVLVETVLSMLGAQPGERVLDLYSGVGLFARFLADEVGEGTRVLAVEADRAAARHARANLAGHERAEVACGPVDEVLATSYDEPFDLVVLDPPREGARRRVVEQVVDRAPRAVAYVACDPAALARDVAIFREHGYRLSALRAFDLFPMTHHVECVALLETTGPDLR